MLAKQCSKFSKPGFYSMRTVNLQMFKLDLEEAEEPEIKLPTSAGSLKKQESSRKTSTSALLTMLKPLTVWTTTNCGNSSRDGNTRPPDLASWEIFMQVKKQQLKLEMEQQTCSKLGKEYVKAVYCRPAYLTEYVMRHARLDEALAWIKISGRNISNLRYADVTTLMAESEELKRLLMKVKEERERAGLKLSIQKMKTMASGPITSWQIDEETMETVTDFIFLDSKITADGDSNHEI